MEKYTYQGTKLTPVERQQRAKSKRHPVPEQEGLVRAKNFAEVSLGYSAETAVAEAKRCLLCPAAPCVQGCPVRIKIPEMLEHVSLGNFEKALTVLKRDNAIPAITGRVCPQEVQCEGACTLKKTSGEALGIGYVERFLADWERKNKIFQPSNFTRSGKRVAVVGSGPGSLSAAADLAKAGCEVHIFEAFHKAGGVLTYGIPAFRLPKEVVDHEIQNLVNLGITIHTNKVIGTLYSIDDLQNELKFDAVYLGIGAGLPKFMSIAGEDLNGVSSANEYLTRVNLMKSYMFPRYDTPVHTGKKIAVVGGGNVAMDAVRTAVRLGAEKAYLIYRRSREEMPARLEEIHHAEEEGVEFLFLHNPTRYNGDEKGWLKSVECVRMELGEPDASGRRSPRVVPNSTFALEIDMAIVAVGTGANPLVTQATPDLQTNKWGYVAADAQFRTSKRGVFAGGDIVRGAATVILAMGDGRAAAASILNYLETKDWPQTLEPAF
jgi:glutamate synthase (NADPH/NADH) small chain